MWQDPLRRQLLHQPGPVHIPKGEWDSSLRDQADESEKRPDAEPEIIPDTDADDLDDEVNPPEPLRLPSLTSTPTRPIGKAEYVLLSCSSCNNFVVGQIWACLMNAIRKQSHD